MAAKLPARFRFAFGISLTLAIFIVRQRMGPE